MRRTITVAVPSRAAQVARQTESAAEHRWLPIRPHRRFRGDRTHFYFSSLCDQHNNIMVGLVFLTFTPSDQKINEKY